MSREFVETQVQHLVHSHNPRGVLAQVVLKCSPRSAPTVVSRIRCAVRDQHPGEVNKPYMRRFRPPGNTRCPTTTDEDTIKRRDTKVAVREPQKIIDRCRELLHACGTSKRRHHEIILASPFDALAALALVSGRKPMQIIKDSVFASASTSEYAVKVKTNGRQLTVLLRYLRTQLSAYAHMSNETIYSRFSHKFGAAAKNLLGARSGRFQDLRVIYAICGFAMFKHTLDGPRWVHRALGVNRFNMGRLDDFDITCTSRLR